MAPLFSDRKSSGSECALAPRRHLAMMGELQRNCRCDTPRMACRLLTETNEHISRIALSLGYAGASSFNRTFMRRMKVQPESIASCTRTASSLPKSERVPTGPHWREMARHVRAIWRNGQGKTSHGCSAALCAWIEHAGDDAARGIRGIEASSDSSRSRGAGSPGGGEDGGQARIAQRPRCRRPVHRRPSLRGRPAPTAPPLPPQVPAWTYIAMPYAWLPSINGTTTVRAAPTGSPPPLGEILDRPIPEELFGLMGAFEARSGRFGIMTDLTYMKLGVSGNGAAPAASIPTSQGPWRRRPRSVQDVHRRGGGCNL